MIQMIKGERPYRQSHVAYATTLFQKFQEPAAGKLVHISNGGYETYGPRFAFRVYYDKQTGTYTTQVISDAMLQSWNEGVCETKTIQQDETVNLTTIITAILYRESIARVNLSRVEGLCDAWYNMIRSRV